MKRELALLLEGQPEFTGSLGRTRASKVGSCFSNGVSKTEIKRKPKGLLSSNESEVEILSILCNKDLENNVNKRFKGSSGENELKNDDIIVEAVVEEESMVRPMNDEGLNIESALSIIKAESKDDEVIPSINKRDTAGTLVAIDDGKVQNVTTEKPGRRFTRSLLKPKAEQIGNFRLGYDGSGVLEGARSETSPKVEEIETIAMSTSTTLRKKMELKMSKKIALNNIPSTVRELLETGLLEGLQVTYIDGKKENPVSRLQGTVKGVGILCSCSSCKGLEIVSPSKFERHACKVYRHMSTYIYLENGKNFNEVLKACKDSPLDSLEATILEAIGSIPLKKSIICRVCKVSFLSSSAAKVGPLCNSCMESKKSPASPGCTSGRVARKSPASPGRTSGRVACSSKAIVVSKSAKRTSLCYSSQKKNRWKITKKDQRLHRLVFEEGGLPDGTELNYYSRGKKLLEGYKKGFGIFCRCCNCEVSPSQFETHAGRASRKKPYSAIYTSNGVSLHELAISLSKGRRYSVKECDDLCIICNDGGNLLLCDGCPRAFHKECASLSSVPRGKWYCKYCHNNFQRERHVERNANALAAGRVSGVDPIEQINQRCIRIIKNPEAEASACALCRGCDYSKSKFGPRTIILCDQCEMEFHVGCLKDYKMLDLKELPRGKWFCCMDCRRIHSTVHDLLARGAEKLPDSLLTVIRNKQGSNSTSDLDVRWRLLSGKFASPETRFLLSKAVAIFHNSFNPIVDPTTGQDLIPSMVYGRNIGAQEYGGMYCAVLVVNSTVISAGILRVYGREVAELPLVATSNEYQGKGYFQILFSCIMKLLAFLNVRSIVLPAAEVAEAIWTNKFGFKKIVPNELSNLRKSYCQLTTFQGTSMLKKMVPGCRIIHNDME